MCLADYAIGFGTFCSERIVTIGLTSGIVVEANPKRSMLIFVHPPSGYINLSTIQPAVLTTGIRLATGDQQQYLTVPLLGNLPTKAWYGIAASAPVTISVFEGEFDLAQAREFIRRFNAG